MIREGERVLLCKRPPGGEHGGLWEFPGGKVEAGEDDREALRRELLEELGVEVIVGARLASYPVRTPRKRLQFEVFACRIAVGRPEAIGVAELRWLRAEELADYPVPEADEPVIALLRGGAPRVQLRRP